MDAIAIVSGQPLTEPPVDLFIPPDALEVCLETFSGPLDLLLYLIKRQNIDILNIPIAQITAQYIEYIEWMEARTLALAADYLVMAAMLMEIKSKLLLPVSMDVAEELESDPRAELVRRLQQYEQFKQAAMALDAIPRYDRDVFPLQIHTKHLRIEQAQPTVSLLMLVKAMQGLLTRQTHSLEHHVQAESLSVRERMTTILHRLETVDCLELGALFVPNEGRMGLIVSLLAILELAKQSLLVVTQVSAFSFLYVRRSSDEPR